MTFFKFAENAFENLCEMLAIFPSISGDAVV